MQQLNDQLWCCISTNRVPRRSCCCWRKLQVWNKYGSKTEKNYVSCYGPGVSDCDCKLIQYSGSEHDPQPTWTESRSFWIGPRKRISSVLALKKSNSEKLQIQHWPEEEVNSIWTLLWPAPRSRPVHLFQKYAEVWGVICKLCQRNNFRWLFNAWQILRVLKPVTRFCCTLQASISANGFSLGAIFYQQVTILDCLQVIVIGIRWGGLSLQVKILYGWFTASDSV